MSLRRRITVKLNHLSHTLALNLLVICLAAMTFQLSGCGVNGTHKGRIASPMEYDGTNPLDKVQMKRKVRAFFGEEDGNELLTAMQSLHRNGTADDTYRQSSVSAATIVGRVKTNIPAIHNLYRKITSNLHSNSFDSGRHFIDGSSDSSLFYLFMMILMQLINDDGFGNNVPPPATTPGSDVCYVDCGGRTDCCYPQPSLPPYCYDMTDRINLSCYPEPISIYPPHSGKGPYSDFCKTVDLMPGYICDDDLGIIRGDRS